MEYCIYTDGSALGKTPFYYGGWSVVIFKGKATEENFIDILSGNGYPMTNNQAELIALLKAIQFCKELYKKDSNNTFTIYSDSQYSIRCITEWCHSWKKNNWINSKKQEVANKDLIKQIMEELYFTSTFIKIAKVKGHNKNYGNELADSEAGRQSAMIKAEKEKVNNGRENY